MCARNRVTYNCGHEGRGYIIPCPAAQETRPFKVCPIERMTKIGETQTRKKCPACGGPRVTYDDDKPACIIYAYAYWEYYTIV